MKHYSKDTQLQARNLINAMDRAGYPAFDKWNIGLNEIDDLNFMVQTAKRLSKIAEHECNGHEYKGMLAKRNTYSLSIMDIASKFALFVVFEGDPRGYVVKLHAQKRDVYNTWGGKESGFGIG